MNDPAGNPDESLDALEQELQTLVPRGLSPIAHQDITAKLATSAGRRRLLLWTALPIAATVCATLLIGWFIYQNANSPDEPIAKTPPTPEVPQTANHDALLSDQVPTFWAYHQAAKQSYDELDQLLAQHGSTSMGGDTPLPAIGFE